jgi:hypothetical protein
VANAVDDLLPEFRVKYKFRAEGLGNGLTGRVIYGWAKTAGGDDDVGALKRLEDGFRDAPGVIAYGLGTVQVHAQPAQGARNEAGIGVGCLAKQEFGPNRDDFCGGHAVIIFVKQSGRQLFCRPELTGSFHPQIGFLDHFIIF